MKNILVTGASGQLGKCFQKHSKKYPHWNFHFLFSAQLDITSQDSIQKTFKEGNFDVCINCAAYTNVEQAENEPEKAFLINAEAVKNLAKITSENNCILIHFSTDYVFNGNAEAPYSEEDEVDPVNEYGRSKLQGEQFIQEIADKYYIFRTSWLYSEFGHNFFNTILKKAGEGAELNITTSQRGTPTNANDLAEYVLKILNFEKQEFNLYHFSNEGEATWYDFAEAILDFSGNREKVKLNKTGFYKTLAERPSYSVLSKKKLKDTFPFEIPEWKTSLKDLLTEN
ncbi:dTDP-4-dehydrorhamnose reductase [Christiangramia fulva]|uniref:dTDP-4-dehydrorhamnose reductase n=1 Tax=Christiangramia fulva TaxID=2126553 RepID=A0A2R3Z3R7_9FLAO|nr:dTDP-4-dehydrorhamnose reductase [Christiangramia fulva]AVR44852.1 dTDP-4-dehydrorhamnose reductase [Christiangramia fulva]